MSHASIHHVPPKVMNMTIVNCWLRLFINRHSQVVFSKTVSGRLKPMYEVYPSILSPQNLVAFLTPRRVDRGEYTRCKRTADLVSCERTCSTLEEETSSAILGHSGWLFRVTNFYKCPEYQQAKDWLICFPVLCHFAGEKYSALWAIQLNVLPWTIDF